MPANDIAKKIQELLVAPRPHGRPSYIIGPGAERVRAAQGMIRRLAVRPQAAEAIPTRLALRPIVSGTTAPIETGAASQPAIDHRAAIANSTAHLKPGFVEAPRLDPRAAQLMSMTTDLARRRTTLEPMLERLRAGVSSPAELLRGRALARQAGIIAAASSDGGGGGGTMIANVVPGDGGTTSSGGNGNTPTNTAVTTPDTTNPLDDEIRGLTKTMLETAAAAGSALQSAVLRVPETSYHEFAEYLFIRDPNSLLGPDDKGQGGSAGSLEQFLSGAKTTISNVVEAFCTRQIPVANSKYAALNLTPYFPQFIASIYNLFLANVAGDLFEFIATVQPGYTSYSGSVRDDVLRAFGEWLRLLVQQAQFDPNALGGSFDHPENWTTAGDAIVQAFFTIYPDARVTAWVPDDPNSYTFTPFPNEGVNFGLRVLYRQEWRPLGTQPGEIVRTIPLGPKQVERVSTKIVTSDKVTRSTETSTTIETTNESSNTTKDSDDVVNEASSKLNWHADAEASGGFFGWSAKVSAGASGERAASSKDTKSRLNDTMQRTASKMTRNVKVVVSTEHQTTTELNQSSEIVNPNDEIAITYVYSKLQRQYEIVTTISEVNTVVFVPERIPAPTDIDESWVRRYDWILSKALLDASFEDDLQAATRDVAEPPVVDDGDTFKNAAATATGAIGDYKGYTGGTLPDLFSSPHSNYDRFLDKQRANAAAIARRAQRNERLISHIRQNILHYMRAIWSAEDADQRLRRYARVLAPTQWDFVPADPAMPPGPDGLVDGEFLPDLGPTSMKPVSELINPAGPLGFAGNYAVFLQKSDREVTDLNKALAALRQYYMRFVVQVSGTGSDAAYDAFVVDPRHRSATYTVVRVGPSSWQAAIKVTDTTSTPVTIGAAPDDSEINFDGVRVRFEPPPAPGVTLTVDVQGNDELEDPEIYQLRRDEPLPPPSREALFYTPETLAEISQYLPEVGALFPADLTGGWGALADDAKQAVRKNYYRFLMTRDHTTRFLMETNNLTLDVDVGATPVLEDFKRLHRTIDVLKELEEAGRRQLENMRRGQRIATSDLADPDIENVTLVNMPSSMTPGINVTPPAGPSTPTTPNP